MYWHFVACGAYSTPLCRDDALNDHQTHQYASYGGSKRALEMLRSAHLHALLQEHELVGLQHLLLALSEEEGSVVWDVLRSYGVATADLEAAVVHFDGTGELGCFIGKLPISGDVRLRLTGRAHALAKRIGLGLPDTEHIMLAILEHPNTVTSSALDFLGISRKGIEVAIRERIAPLDEPRSGGST